jgi:hypothetical protein
MSHNFYSPKTSESDEEGDAFLPDLEVLRKTKRNARLWHKFMATLPWILSTVLGTLSFAIIIERNGDTVTTKFGSYENGFDTDSALTLHPERSLVPQFMKF